MGFKLRVVSPVRDPSSSAQDWIYLCWKSTSVVCVSVGGENEIGIFWGFILKMNTLFFFFFLGLALKVETDSGWYLYWAVSVIAGNNFLVKIGVNASTLHLNCAVAGSTACRQGERLVHNLSCGPHQITDHRNFYFRSVLVKRGAII